MDENEIQKENKSYEQAEIPPELRYDPFPGTTYSASGKPVNMPPEEAAPQKKTKKKKDGHKRRMIVFAAVLVLICFVVSTVSGAVSSVLVYSLLPEKGSWGKKVDPDELTTDDVIFETEAPVIVTEAPTEHFSTENVTSVEPATVVPVTEAPTEPPTTLPPVIKKTKSEIYNDAVNSVVGITSLYDRTFRTLLGTYYTRQYGSTGSGFFISDDGYIVTNYHVVANGTDITVSTYDDETYKARVVGFDDGNDIAVLKIDAKTKDVKLGSSDEAMVGDDVMVIGNALTTLSYTFTDGVISYKNRKISTETNEQINMFQTNAAINSGNSGGPVYNMDGEVIGIASAKFASDQIEGLCFFIPIDDVRDRITDIIRAGA